MFELMDAHMPGQTGVFSKQVGKAFGEERRAVPQRPVAHAVGGRSAGRSTVR